jgi:hypothetical protein
MEALIERCRRHPSWFAVFLSLLVSFLVMNRFFLFGHTYIPTDVLHSFPLWYDWVSTTQNWDIHDVLLLFYPHDLLFSQELSEGRLFFWNPYNFLGHPVFADGKSGMLYPLRLLLTVFFPTHMAHDLYLWFHLVMIGVTGHWFLRELDFGVLPASVGSCVWTLSGAGMGWFEHEHAITFGAYLPAALALYHMGITKDRRYLALATVILALPAYAGNVQLLSFILLSSGFWSLYLWWTKGGKELSLLVCLGVSLFLPLFLAAPQLIPTFELVSLTQRAQAPPDVFMSAYRDFLTGLAPSLLAPDFVGNPVDGFHLSRVANGADWIYGETWSYVGILALLLAGLGFCSNHPHRRFFSIGLILLVILPATPAWLIPYYLLPGFKQTMSTRLVYLIDFCLSILAAYGTRYFMTARPKILFRTSYIAAGLGVFVVVGFSVLKSNLHAATIWALQKGLVRFPSPEVHDPKVFPQVVWTKVHAYYDWSNPALWLPVVLIALAAALFYCRASGWVSNRLVGALILIFVIADPLYGVIRFQTACPLETLYPVPLEVQWLKRQQGYFRVMGVKSVKPNTLMPFHLADIGGLNSLYPARNAAYLNALQNGHPNSPLHPFMTQAFPITNTDSPLINLSGVRYLICYPNQELPGPRYRLVKTGQLRIFENTEALPLARVVEKAEGVESFEKALERLLDPRHDPLSTVLIEGMEATEDGAAGSLELQTWRPGYAEMQVDLPQGGWVVFNEANYPGWEANLDGKSLEIKDADALFMAVKVPPTEAGKLVFSFTPGSLNTGVKVGAVAGILWLAFLTFLVLRRPASKPEDEEAG